QEGIAVWFGASDLAGAEVGVGAWAVDHQEGLSQAPGESVGEEARKDVGATAGGERHDQFDRARGVSVLSGPGRGKDRECCRDGKRLGEETAVSRRAPSHIVSRSIVFNSSS